MTSLSDFDQMRQRLTDWGVHGWVHLARCLHPEDGCLVEVSAIYEMGRADRDGDEESAPEPDRKIDVRDCEWLDVLIMDLDSDHRRHICLYFYKHKAVAREKVDAAIRALLDREYAAQGKDLRVA